MVNALIITKNIAVVQKLLREFTLQNLNIVISEITTSRDETDLILKIQNFNIIFLDESQKLDYSEDFIQKYKNDIILISYDENSNLITHSILQEILSIVKSNDFDKKRSNIIRELEYIGYKFNHKGTHYLLDTILQMYDNQNTMVDNLQSKIYPILAEKYNKSVFNIKSSINKATECMYCECDSDKLEEYFKFGYDTKPTVKQVVFTIINKI